MISARSGTARSVFWAFGIVGASLIVSVFSAEVRLDNTNANALCAVSCDYSTPQLWVGGNVPSTSAKPLNADQWRELPILHHLSCGI